MQNNIICCPEQKKQFKVSKHKCIANITQKKKKKKKPKEINNQVPILGTDLTNLQSQSTSKKTE